MTKISVTVGNEFAALVSLKRGDQIYNLQSNFGASRRRWNGDKFDVILQLHDIFL